MNQEHEIVLYQVEDTNIYVNVMFKEDTFWMTQKAMADLFECTTDNISLHLKNIYKEEELDENRTTEFFSVVQNEGQRNVKRKVKCYNKCIGSANVCLKIKNKGDLNDESYIQKCLVFRILAKIR